MVNGSPEMDKPMSDLEEILNALYESENQRLDLVAVGWRD
jgi:hypothetical protein